MVVGRQVAVDEVVHEVHGAPVPVEMEVLHEEAGDDHAHPVVHPPLGQELAHAGVDDREARAPLLPRPERVVGGRPAVDVHRAHGFVEGQAHGVGPVEQHVRVEVAPAQLGAEHVVGPGAAQLCEQLAGVDAAPLEEGRQAGGGVEVGPVAVLGVVAERAVEERPGPRHGGRLAGRGQVGVDLRGLGDPVAWHARGPRHGRGGGDRIRPTVDAPRLRERGEDLEVLAAGVDDVAGRYGIGRPDADQLDGVVGEGPLDLLVAAPAVGPEVLGDEHAIGAHLSGQGRDRAGGRPGAHREGAVDAGVQGPEAPVHEGETGRAGGSAQLVVEAEDRHDRAARAGVPERLGQRRVVGQAEVTPEPHHGGRHVGTVPAGPRFLDRPWGISTAFLYS
ncbi:MAG TPA: hypothetical protein VK306_01000 [Acidimicrobiales bacterium]|nr:hypothetical protein [Acidimicrobiales bacterium]